MFRHPVGTEGDAPGEVDRRFVAEQFLDRVPGEFGRGVQEPELVGMAQQREGPTGDQVDGRLVAGDVDHGHLGHQFVVVEPVAVVLGVDEGGEQVVATVVALAAFLTRALDLRLSAAVLVLILLSIEVSNILPTLPGQLGTSLPCPANTSPDPAGDDHNGRKHIST